MKSINIRGHKYTVTRVDEFEDAGTIGHCTQKDASIKVLKGMPESIEAETTIHEVLHALCYHAGIYPNKSGMVNGEQIIDSLANGLFQLGFKPPIT